MTWSPLSVFLITGTPLIFTPFKRPLAVHSTPPLPLQNTLRGYVSDVVKINRHSGQRYLRPSECACERILVKSWTALPLAIGAFIGVGASSLLSSRSIGRPPRTLTA